MGSAVIITCEHGGNHVPPFLGYLFADKSELLHSHRGWDPGALELAEKISADLNCPFFFEKTSRLVVDQNRSRSNREVFSEVSLRLSLKQKNEILAHIYDPYHDLIISSIDELLRASNGIHHFSIHSFTSELNGVIRNADLGLLYDPVRKEEKKICMTMMEEMHKEIPGIRTRRNYPYKGTSDGLTTALRKRYPGDIYTGIEIELNQTHYEKKDGIWSALLNNMAKFINESVK